MPNDEQIHKNHRERLKSQFRNSGLESLTKIQILEMLLFFSNSQKDTNPIAHRLLERFGTINDVLNASPAELKKVDGVGPVSVDLLKLIPELARYLEMERRKSPRFLRTIDACGDYLVPYFYGLPNETVYMLCLDPMCKVITCQRVTEGSVNSAGIPVRRIAQMALEYKASSVVLAHNHPGGVALPSAEDVMATRRVALALDAVEIVLTDHIIVAEDDFVSLVQSGLYHPENCRLEY